MGYINNLRKYVGNSPLIMVACGAIIMKGSEILLQKREDNGLWGFHGGALEPGESFEDTVKRELFEELGITVTKCHLFKSYSGKDFYFKYPNGDEVYIIDNIFIIDEYKGNFNIDNNEVLELKWFNVNEIPWDDVVFHNALILKEYFKTLEL